MNDEVQFAIDRDAAECLAAVERRLAQRRQNLQLGEAFFGLGVDRRYPISRRRDDEKV